MRPGPSYWIDALGLKPHEEGGAYRELYRSDVTISKDLVPGGFHHDPCLSTSIFFLLEAHQFSAFHSICSDEIWHFYYGDPLIVYELSSDGHMVENLLGQDPGQGQNFQATIRAGNWFGACVAEGGQYSLVGCTVAPGFDFSDLRLAKREELINQYPLYAQIISRLTH